MAPNSTLEAMATATQPEVIQPAIEVPRGKPCSELLAYAYLRLRQEDQLQNLLWENWPPIGIKKFLEWAETVIILGCYLRPTLGKDPVLAGLGLIGKIQQVGEYRKFEIGMAFFREYQRHHLAERFTEELIDYCFVDAEADFIYGVSPIHNRAANRFARRIGFDQVIIPNFAWWRGVPCDGVYSSMAKWEWKARAGRKA